MERKKVQLAANWFMLNNGPQSMTRLRQVQQYLRAESMKKPTSRREKELRHTMNLFWRMVSVWPEQLNQSGDQESNHSSGHEVEQ